MRATYETEATRRAEGFIADIVAGKWRCDAVHLPNRFQIDYGFYRGERLQCFVEIKCRTNSATAYPDYMVAMDKFARLVDLSRISRRPSYLVVSFTDSIQFCDVTQIKVLDIRDGGRALASRGDWQDREPCVYIPMSEFKLIARIDNGTQT